MDRYIGLDAHASSCTRGVAVAGRGVYTASKRGEYLDRLPKSAQSLAELLYEQIDALDGLKSGAKKAMLTEAKRHLEFYLAAVLLVGGLLLIATV